MIVFSRAFVRRRAITLATMASVAATSLALAHGPSSAYHLHGAVPVQYVVDRPDLSGEEPFLSESDAAMNKMMADMAAKPTGDVDHDFVAMMVPHHQGAIDMAKAVLRHGHNESDSPHGPGNRRDPAAGDRRDASCGRRATAALGGVADATRAGAGSAADVTCADQCVPRFHGNRNE